MKTIKTRHHNSLFQDNQKNNFNGIYISHISRKSNNSHNKSLMMVKQLPKLAQYGAYSKLKLSRQQMEKIKRSLEIQHQANLNYLKRLENGQLYFNEKKKNESNKQQERALHQKNKIKEGKHSSSDIQIQLSLFDSKQPISIQKIKQRLSPMPISIPKTISKIVKPTKTNKINSGTSSNLIVFQQKKLQKVQDPFQFLQKVLKMPDEKYTQKMWNKKNVNIFKLIHNERQFLNPKQSIDEHYFAYDSIVSVNNQRRNGNIFRDLSSFSRKFIMNNYQVEFQYKLSQADLNINQKHITFSQLMLISTGYLQPRTLNSYTVNYANRNIKNNQNDSNISVDLINYNDNTNNVLTNYNIGQYDIVQKQGYIQVKFTKNQQNQYKYLKRYNGTIIQILNDQLTSLKNCIKDRKLMNNFQNNVDKLLQDRVKVQKRRNEKELNKLISKNKFQKTKIQNINTKMLIQIVKQKKQNDQKKRQLERKSKSPSKTTWR